MCIGVETAIAITALGAGAGITASQAHKQAKKQEHIMERQEKQYKSLMDQYQEDTTVEANSLLRGLSTRDKQKVLARTMGGMAKTSPFGTEVEPLKKKSLLGE